MKKMNLTTYSQYHAIGNKIYGMINRFAVNGFDAPSKTSLISKAMNRKEFDRKIVVDVLNYMEENDWIIAKKEGRKIIYVLPENVTPSKSAYYDPDKKFEIVELYTLEIATMDPDDEFYLEYIKKNEIKMERIQGNRMPEYKYTASKEKIYDLVHEFFLCGDEEEDAMIFECICKVNK